MFTVHRSANFSFLLFVLMLLGACRSVAPPESYSALVGGDEQFFFTAWEADAPNSNLQTRTQYMEWVVRFYNGAANLPGWSQMTEQVLARLPAEKQGSVAAQLSTLGKRIGAEWAKDNSVRLIDTRIGAVWRDALLEALSENDVDNYLARLTADLDALLKRQLAPDTIQFERYYKDEFDD